MKNETYLRNGEYHFSEDEILEMKNQMVNRTNNKTEAIQKINEHKATIKALNGAISSIDEANKVSAHLIDQGFEMRLVECTREKDYDNSVFVFYNKDTGEEVCREPFSANDYQIGIDE